MNNPTEDDIREYIKILEMAKALDPDCNQCKILFYPKIIKGERVHNIFAPSHKPSHKCESGKRPHCTCDTCF